MAPQRRRSGGSTAGPQQQRTIASFFSAASEKAKKPVLHIGFPADNAAKRKKLEDDAEDDEQLKRPRVIPGEGKTEDCDEIGMHTFSIERPAEGASSPPESKIGKRLKVYWPEEGKWFLGAVESYDGVSGKHKIAYDDGDEEVLLLELENIEWLNEKQVEHGQKRSRRNSANGNCSSLQKCSLEVDAESSDLMNGKKKRLARRKQYVTNSSDESDSQMPSDDVDGLKTDIHANHDEQELLSANESKGDLKRIKKLSAQRRRLTKARDELQVPEVNLESEKIKDFRNANAESEALEQKSAKLILEGEKSRQPANAEARVLESYGSDQAVVLTGEALERFGGRVADKLMFLGKGRKDAAGRRPEWPGFNPRTLFLPAEFLKGLSGGQRQWWEFKAKHMDKVLLFKMGKFYEMFEMDAHIGAQELDLQYMKFDQPHCGFPEKNYSENVERLARKGYRVLVVEQTETPDQLEIRKRKTGAKDKVVRREICAVITKGTMVDADMVGDNADTAYLLATTEKHDDEGSSLIGLCVADTSRALFMLGQVRDDSARTKLRSIVSELRPVELVKPHGLLSEATERVLHEQTRKPLINNLIPYEEFWSAERTVKEINAIYSNARQESERRHSDTVPHLLRKIIELGADGEPALSAFGGCVAYLKQVLLDRQLLKLGRIELLPGSDVLAESINSDDPTFKVDISSGKPHCSEPIMVLDSAALENLEILENNSNGGVSGTLLGLVDHCVTPFGRRLLKQWIVRPLINIESIVERQNALEELQGVAATAVSDFRKELTGIPDIERLLARLSASSGGNGRHAQNVVLYEDAAKTKVKELIAALCGCQTMIKAVSCFGKCLSQLKSVRLQFLLTSGRGFPDLKPLIQYFENAFDWSEAEKSGRVALHEGVDSKFDEASPEISDVKEKLESYLESQRKLFNNSEISYVSVGKESYLLEIPDQLHPKVPAEYELRSSRKGYRRYQTPKVKELLEKLTYYEDQKELASKGILQMLIKRFCEEHKQCLSAVRAISELDAFMSLSCASLHMDGKVCKPIFTPRPGFETMAPSFNAKALRHPIAGLGTAAGCPFVPNDVVLGGGHSPHFMLLTGPNMGGKSTLIRQVCLAIILAQVGADVPAEMLQLSPTDRLFVRMGAKDHILSGQSTFLVELSETASMLRCATRNSFVALDELGRGTATSDGQAIAHAVLQHLAHTIQCRGIFSSHYHKLANEHAYDPAIACYHMACKVGTGADGLDAVTFLYRLTPGPCPKSYGVNVARLAGMPEIVLHRAAIQSAKLEEEEQLQELRCQRNNGKTLGDREVKLIEDIFKCDEDCGDLTSLWQNVKNVLTTDAQVSTFLQSRKLNGVTSCPRGILRGIA